MAVLEEDEKHGFWTCACIHAPLSTWSKKQKTGMTESNWKYKFEISQSFAYECLLPSRLVARDLHENCGFGTFEVLVLKSTSQIVSVHQYWITGLGI